MDKFELAIAKTLAGYLKTKHSIAITSSCVDAVKTGSDSGVYIYSGESEDFERICIKGDVRSNRVIIEKIEIDNEPLKLKSTVRLTM